MIPNASITKRQIKERACTVCDGIQPWGRGVRAFSKKRCDSCSDGSNFSRGTQMGPKVNEVAKRLRIEPWKVMVVARWVKGEIK